MTKTHAVQEHLIGGSWRPAGSGSTFERIDPFTGEVATVASGASREEARAAVDAAAAAFPAWSRTPADERERLLNAAADLLDERAPAKRSNPASPGCRRRRSASRPAWSSAWRRGTRR